MSPPRTAGLFKVGVHITNTIIDKVTGTLLAVTGDSFQGTTDATNAEIWQQSGLISRPPSPVPGTTSTTEAVVVRRGDRDAIIATRDLRGQQLAGSLAPGETCVYAAGDGGAQGRLLIKKTGSVSLNTLTGNAAGGQTCTIQVNADGSASMATPNGVMSIGSDGSVKAISKGGAGLSLDASGNAALMGKQAAINAGSVVIGSTPATGVATQLAMTPILVALTTLVTQINTILGSPNATTLTATAPLDPSGGAATTAACTALLTLLATAQVPLSGVGFSTNVSSS